MLISFFSPSLTWQSYVLLKNMFVTQHSWNPNLLITPNPERRKKIWVFCVKEVFEGIDLLGGIENEPRYKKNPAQFITLLIHSPNLFWIVSFEAIWVTQSSIVLPAYVQLLSFYSLGKCAVMSQLMKCGHKHLFTHILLLWSL